MSYDVGDTATLRLAIDPADTDTEATVTIAAPDGTALTAPTATPNAGRDVWTAPLPLTSGPGEYVAEWTVTGTGAGTEYHTVTAQVPPPITPAVRQVRLLIADTDPSNRIFPVADVLSFLELEGANVRLAAAQALDTMASSEVLVSKVIRTQDFATDGAKVGAELRARASELRRQVREGDADADEAGGGLEIAYFADPYPLDWL